MTLKEINFIIGGDLGGSKLCIQLASGYPFFSVMKLTTSDFLFSVEIRSMPIVIVLLLLLEIILKRIFHTGIILKEIFLLLHKKGYNYTIDWNNETKLHQIYLDHWLYNRADPNQQNLLNSILYILRLMIRK